MEGHNFEQLKKHILALSNSHSFEIARAEWSLVGVEISEELDKCPCGKDIKEHCFIRNKLNGNETYVGNVCINQFIKIDKGTLFDGLKRIVKNAKANANDDLIEYAHRMGFLYGENEYKFLKETARKRKLTAAQIAWKEKINRRILAQTVVLKRTPR
jgi:hypothetical protein